MPAVLLLLGWLLPKCPSGSALPNLLISCKSSRYFSGPGLEPDVLLLRLLLTDIYVDFNGQVISTSLILHYFLLDAIDSSPNYLWNNYNRT